MISEEMIKNAATEADQAIRDSLPAPAKCEHKFSPLFQRKMCRSFRMVKHPVIYKLPRYAACFVLAAALASGTWLTAEARTAFFAWMREQYEAFVEYRFTGEASQENDSADYELTWLPEGFSLQKEQNLDGGTYLTYTDDSGQRIIFSCLKGCSKPVCYIRLYGGSVDSSRRYLRRFLSSRRRSILQYACLVISRK